MGKITTFLKNIYLSNRRQLPSIYKILFCLTFKCNLKCKICSIWRLPKRKELSVGEIERMFKNLPNLSWLDLTGGEITLREDLIEVVRAIVTSSKNLGLFHMTTNGMFPEKIIRATEEIIRLKCRPMTSVSIDGPQRVHDQLRGHQGSYTHAVEAFKGLKKLKKNHAYISCTISDLNFEYLDELIDSLKQDIPSFSTHDLHFNFYHVSGHYYNNESLGEKGSAKVEFDRIRKYLKAQNKNNFIKKFLEDRYVHYLEKYLRGEKIPFVCQAMHGSIFVDACGTVFPCLFYNKPLGELSQNDYDINKLLRNPELDPLKNEIEHKTCPNCWAPCEAYPAILGNLKTLITDSYRREGCAEIHFCKEGAAEK